METIRVMIAGLPGKMASLVAKQIILAKDLELVQTALAREATGSIKIGELAINLVPSLDCMSNHMKAILDESPDIIVDFTHPKSVNRNAQIYCDCKKPFVVGTTGGDRELLVATVENSKTSAVIAPNMAKQIVALQAMMEYAAKNFPGVFRDYK
ncbi:hypothetical protein ACFL0A_01965 [Patescibacteria group bacterium]